MNLTPWSERALIAERDLSNLQKEVSCIMKNAQLRFQMPGSPPPGGWVNLLIWIMESQANEMAKLRAVVHILPDIEDAKLAILANNSGGYEFRKDLCQCDPSVGMVPCQYCAVELVLSRVLRAAEQAAKVTP